MYTKADAADFPKCLVGALTCTETVKMSKFYPVAREGERWGGIFWHWDSGSHQCVCVCVYVKPCVKRAELIYLPPCVLPLISLFFKFLIYTFFAALLADSLHLLILSI